FPDTTAADVRRVAGDAPVVSLTARSHLPLASKVPIIGTYQGVWPGIAIEENGAKKAGPTGTIWIDTNGARRAGFLRPVFFDGNPGPDALVGTDDGNFGCERQMTARGQ